MTFSGIKMCLNYKTGCVLFRLFPMYGDIRIVSNSYK